MIILAAHIVGVKDSISVISATKWFVGMAQTQMLSVRGVEYVLL